jgi:hypothetical protein
MDLEVSNWPTEGMPAALIYRLLIHEISCCVFVNVWLLNVFVLKYPINLSLTNLSHKLPCVCFWVRVKARVFTYESYVVRLISGTRRSYPLWRKPLSLQWCSVQYPVFIPVLSPDYIANYSVYVPVFMSVFWNGISAVTPTWLSIRIAWTNKMH